MSALNPLLSKVFRGPLDLNEPVLGRVFFLFEYARMYVEEWIEAFDARFGTDTSAPVFEREQKSSVHFYVPTTASLIYEILASLAMVPNKFTFVDMDQVRAAHSSSRPSFRLPRLSGSSFRSSSIASPRIMSCSINLLPSNAMPSI